MGNDRDEVESNEQKKKDDENAIAIDD